MRLADRDKNEPLTLACIKGHDRIVRLLLAHGADLRVRDEDGVTPLHWAAIGNHHRCARLLLEHGADPNVKSNDDLTPLHCVAFGAHDECAMVLLEFGADPNVNYDGGIHGGGEAAPECAASGEPGCGVVCTAHGLAANGGGASVSGETAGEFGVLCGVLEPALEPCRADGT